MCVCARERARARVEPPAVGVEHLHGDDVHPHLPSGLLEQFALLSFNSFFSNFNSEGELKYDVHQHLPSGLRERFALLSFNSIFLSFNSNMTSTRTSGSACGSFSGFSAFAYNTLPVEFLLSAFKYLI